MALDKEKFKDPRAALNFLIEANIISVGGLEDVPASFVERQMKLVKKLTLSTPKEIATKSLRDLLPSAEGEGQRHTPSKTWRHRSVTQLMRESRSNDPVNEIKSRARQLVLKALSKGWGGPPYDAVELAQLLNYELEPSESVSDARIVPLPGGSFKIEYNPFQKTNRKNFSISHEIAHTLFTDCSQAIRNREDNPTENRELEQLCNIAASELQFPYVIFPAEANALPELDIHEILKLANKYGSSIESLLLAFVDAVDKSCAVMISTFINENEISLDYFKRSQHFDLKIPNEFRFPADSRAYYCIKPGNTEKETVQWEFMDNLFDAFYVGISPMRRENKPRIATLLVPNKTKEKIQNRRIQIEWGDATKPRGKGIKIIAQVVNTSAALGIGFGKSLSKNYPVIKDELKKWKSQKKSFTLGSSQIVQVKHDTYVFQMLAQNGLRSKAGETLLDYPSLRACLSDLRSNAKELGADVYMPLIGAGQARGDWNIIEGLIFSELVNRDVKTTIYVYQTNSPADFKPRSSLSTVNEKSTWETEK